MCAYDSELTICWSSCSLQCPSPCISFSVKTCLVPKMAPVGCKKSYSQRSGTLVHSSTWLPTMQCHFGLHEYHIILDLLASFLAIRFLSSWAMLGWVLTASQWVFTVSATHRSVIAALCHLLVLSTCYCVAQCCVSSQCNCASFTATFFCLSFCRIYCPAFVFVLLQ